MSFPQNEVQNTIYDHAVLLKRKAQSLIIRKQFPIHK